MAQQLLVNAVGALHAVNENRRAFDTLTTPSLVSINNTLVAVQERYGPGAVTANVFKTSIGTLQSVHMGLSLYGGQHKTLMALDKLVAATALPSQFLPHHFTFSRKYINTDQHFAELAAIGSKPGGGSTRETLVEFKMANYAVSKKFDKALIFQTNNQIAEVIFREHARVAVSWDLTKARLLLEYCASQLKLVDAVGLSQPIMTPEVITGMLNTVDLFCGSLNVNPRNFNDIIRSSLTAMSMDDPPIIIVPTRIMSAIAGEIDSIPANLDDVPRKFMTYEVTPTGGENLYAFNIDYKDFPAGTTVALDMAAENTLVDRNSVLKVKISPEQEGHIIVIDAVNMGRQGGSLQDTLCDRNCVKYEYFTVGGLPSITREMSANIILDAVTGELTPRDLAQRSPRTSYVFTTGTGTIKRVDITSIHKEFIVPAMFEAPRRNEMATVLLGEIGDAFSYTARDVLALTEQRNFEEKLKNRVSVLEVDSRLMVRHNLDNNRVFSRVNPPVVVPRVCLYNGSPMNDWEGDATQVASELMAMLSKKAALGPMVEALELYTKSTTAAGLNAVVTLRNAAVPTPQMVAGNNVMADPICHVLIARAVDAGNDLVLQQKKSMISDFISEVLDVFRTICGNVENTVLGMFPDNGFSLGQNFTPEDALYCKIMYNLVLPCFTNTACVAGNQQNLGVANQHDFLGIQYFSNNFNGADVVFINGAAPVGWIGLVSHYPTANPTAIPSNALVTPLWRARLDLLRKISPLPRFLLSIHYSQYLNAENIVNRFDKDYASGLSYLCIRPMEFDAWGVAVMPRDKTIVNHGTMKVLVNEDNEGFLETQHKEMNVCPREITDTGIFIDSIFIDNVRNEDVRLDGRHTNVIVMDSFNNYVPNGNQSVGNGVHLLAHGRSTVTGLLGEDPYLAGQFSSMPTLHHALSAGYWSIRRNLRGNLKKAAEMFLSAKPVTEIRHTYNLLMNKNKQYITNKISGQLGRSSLLQKETGVLFASTYSIGRASEHSLKNGWRGENRETLTSKLTPRINGTGLLTHTTSGEGGAFEAQVFKNVKVGWRQRILF